jgi:hypothetical protein
MLQCYVKEFRALTEANVDEVEDELGVVVMEVGDGVVVSRGLYPTIWKGV